MKATVHRFVRIRMVRLLREQLVKVEAFRQW